MVLVESGDCDKDLYEFQPCYYIVNNFVQSFIFCFMKVVNYQMFQEMGVGINRVFVQRN